jgi:hypothetical protein
MSLQDEKITIATLTGGEREGAGAFEEIMRGVKSHLVEEFNSGRITGADYTQAYISSLTMSMSTASMYLLQHKIANQQVLVLDEQITQAKLNQTLTQGQIDKVASDKLLVDTQKLKIDADTALTSQQLQIAIKQEAKLDSDILNSAKDLELKDKQLILTDAQTTMISAQTANEPLKGDQLLASTLKTNSEKDVLTQRLVSEEAQTKDTVNGQAVGGILGKQMNLFTNQAEGYIRDAEQKAAKIMNDTFITRVSTDYDSADATSAGMSDADVAKVIAKLHAGINVV